MIAICCMEVLRRFREGACTFTIARQLGITESAVTRLLHEAQDLQYRAKRAKRSVA